MFRDWKMDSFVESSIQSIREKVGSGKVLCALSGGVDSSVAAVMLAKAVGKQLTCVFVDHGLLRKDEGRRGGGCLGPQWPLWFWILSRVNAQDVSMKTERGGGAGAEEKDHRRRGLSVYLKMKQRRSARWLFLCRVPFTRIDRVRTWKVSRDQVSPQRGRTSGSMWILRRSSSRCAFCLRMR